MWPILFRVVLYGRDSARNCVHWDIYFLFLRSRLQMLGWMLAVVTLQDGFHPEL
jgi:hypothetical protein